MTITTRAGGVAVQATRTADGWEAVLMPEVPVMERPWELRSTFASQDLWAVLNAACSDALGWSEVVY